MSSPPKIMSSVTFTRQQMMQTNYTQQKTSFSPVHQCWKPQRTTLQKDERTDRRTDDRILPTAIILCSQKETTYS